MQTGSILLVREKTFTWQMSPALYTHHLAAINDCTGKRNYISKAECYFLGQIRFMGSKFGNWFAYVCAGSSTTKVKGPELTELRSFRPAPRVNFLAKRKQGAGLSLLVHHSFLYSVS